MLSETKKVVRNFKELEGPPETDSKQLNGFAGDQAKITGVVSDEIVRQKSCFAKTADAKQAQEIKSVFDSPPFDGWSQPKALGNFDDLPDFPLDGFSETTRDMISWTARVNQVDPSMAATTALSGLSTAVANKAIIHCPTHDEGLNLYLIDVAESGERKSATLNCLIKPIRNYETDLRISFREEGGEGAPPSICIDDITAEALGVVMQRNGDQISIISAEGGIFRILSGLYNSKGANIDLILKAYQGEPWSVHRITRDSIYMDQPILTMGIGIQPEFLQTVVSDPRFIQQGFLARLLIVRCKPYAGTRRYSRDSIPSPIKDSYNGHLTRLLEMAPDRKPIQLAEDTLDIWANFHDTVEKRLIPGGAYYQIKDWACKLPGSVLRIAGILHLDQHGAHGLEMPIGSETMVAAVHIGNFFAEHTRFIFLDTNCIPGKPEAEAILEFISSRSCMEFTVRELMRGKYRFKQVDDTAPGLKLLSDKGYIRKKVAEHTGTVGRPPADVYQVNPMIAG